MQTDNDKIINKVEYNKLYCREWYKNNKQRHIQYVCEYLTCECGKVVQRSNMARHLRTPIHKRLISRN